MNTTKLPDSQKTVISPENHPEKLKQPESGAPGDIHKVVDGQVVPTRAPSGVEQDISPGNPTKSR